MADAMVRRLLAGEKTQTRRLIKPQPDFTPKVVAELTSCRPGVPLSAIVTDAWKSGFVKVRCPYGVPGDRLWVREAWALETFPEDGERLVWRADRCAVWRGSSAAPFYLPSDYEPERWRPSIHMPRWASRFSLEVTDIRVQRLQDLSEEDAKAEGSRYFGHLLSTHPYGQDARWSMEEPTRTEQCLGSARHAFGNYVNTLHGGPLWNCKKEPSLWDQNPWVWAVTFRRVEAA
jgi:hypothetical protein